MRECVLSWQLSAVSLYSDDMSLHRALHLHPSDAAGVHAVLMCNTVLRSEHHHNAQLEATRRAPGFAAAHCRHSTVVEGLGTDGEVARVLLKRGC
jgi:hypothetical protein